MSTNKTVIHCSLRVLKVIHLTRFEVKSAPECHSQSYKKNISSLRFLQPSEKPVSEINIVCAASYVAQANGHTRSKIS